VKRNLKLLYLLTLAALCLYVTTGPAEAITSVNIGPISGATASFEGGAPPVGLDVSYGPTFAPDWGNRVDLGVNVLCVSAPCAATVDFNFYVSAPGSITVELHGTSNDPNAEGAVLFPFSDADPPWDVNGDFQLSMDPFTVPVGVGRYYGQFTITSLAEGGFVNLGPESLEFTYNSAVPEPGSALLLGAGIAFVAFLRRKTQR
jgi:hypothetical protein